MGAHLLHTTLDGSKSREDLKRWFDSTSDNARHESGNSYSGDWNMMTGLRIEDRVLNSEHDAYEYISSHTEKWETALAIKFKANTPAALAFSDPKDAYAQPLTLIAGGNIPALALIRYSHSKNTFYVADLVPAGKRARLTALAATMAAANRKRDAAMHALSALTRPLGYELGTPDWAALKAAHKAATKAKADFEKTIAAYRKLADPIYEKRGTNDLGIKWMVGGWAAS